MAWTEPRTWVTGETVTAALLNTDHRDNLDFLHADWDDWTPTLTGITQGNGTVVARYVQHVNTVHAYFIFTFDGATSAMGTGVVSLPVTASASYLAQVSLIGVTHYHDASGPSQIFGALRLESTTTARPLVIGVGSVTSSVSTTAPFTWSHTDRLVWEATYEAA